MNNPDFPWFGICPICGSNSGDVPQSDLGPADAGYAITSDPGSGDDVRTVANDYGIVERGEGVPLIRYQGKLMCQVCKNRLESDTESRLVAKSTAVGDRKRSSMGFGGVN